jgi:hypothetical protein
MRPSGTHDGPQRTEETMSNHHMIDAPMSPERMQVRFGQNTVLVERFLLRLSKLPVAEWMAVGAAYEGLVHGRVTQFAEEGTIADADAWASAEAALCGAMASQESARNRVTRRVVNVAEATKGFVPHAAYDSMLQAALTAVQAIICREEIGSAAFHRLYAPFAPAIPIAELEHPSS